MTPKDQWCHISELGISFFYLYVPALICRHLLVFYILLANFYRAACNVPWAIWCQSSIRWLTVRRQGQWTMPGLNPILSNRRCFSVQPCLYRQTLVVTRCSCPGTLNPELSKSHFAVWDFDSSGFSVPGQKMRPVRDNLQLLTTTPHHGRDKLLYL